MRSLRRRRGRNRRENSIARSVGKSEVNSPLFQCAVCGNDPNVGRLVCAIGKHVGAIAPGTDLGRAKLTLGGQVIYQDGAASAARVASSMRSASTRDSRRLRACMSTSAVVKLSRSMRATSSSDRP